MINNFIQQQIKNLFQAINDGRRMPNGDEPRVMEILNTIPKEYYSELKDSNDVLLIELACNFGYPQVVDAIVAAAGPQILSTKLFYNYGDPNETTKTGFFTPIGRLMQSFAPHNRVKLILETILKHNPELAREQCTSNGNTPMHEIFQELASSFNRYNHDIVEIFEILLKHGADLAAKNNLDMIPFDYYSKVSKKNRPSDYERDEVILLFKQVTKLLLTYSPSFPNSSKQWSKDLLSNVEFTNVEFTPLKENLLKLMRDSVAIYKLMNSDQTLNISNKIEIKNFDLLESILSHHFKKDPTKDFKKSIFQKVIEGVILTQEQQNTIEILFSDLQKHIVDNFQSDLNNNNDISSSTSISNNNNNKTYADAQTQTDEQDIQSNTQPNKLVIMNQATQQKSLVYSEAQIDRLLNQKIKAQPIVKIIDFSQDSCLEAELAVLVKPVLEANKIILMILKVADQTYSSLMIKKNDDVLKLIYNDPTGRPYTQEPKIKSMMSNLKDLHETVSTIDLLQLQQQEGNDCFTFAVDNLVKLFNNSAKNLKKTELQQLLAKSEQVLDIKSIHSIVLNNSPEYIDAKVQKLLAIELKNKEMIVAPTVNFDDKKQLQEMITKIAEDVNNSGKSAVVPIHPNTHHWTGLVIKKQADGGLQVVYNDPRGNKLSTNEYFGSLVKALTKVNPNVHIIDLHTQQQAQFKDSGVFTVDNLVKLASCDTNLSSDAMQQLLLICDEHGQTTDLRTHHNNELYEYVYSPEIIINLVG